MIDDKKSTDLGLSAAERKTLRNREAKEAIAEHEEAQRALHGNLERLREERLAREAAAGSMVVPTPELPDDTPIERVLFSTRIRNALNVAGMKTIGEVRETSDDTLLSLQDLGPSSISYLRETLGLPSRRAARLVCANRRHPDVIQSPLQLARRPGPVRGDLCEEPAAQLAGNLLKGHCGQSTAADEAK